MTRHLSIGEWISFGLLALLAIALVVAASTDIRRRQIDNGLNVAIAAGAPLFWWSCGLDLPAVGAQLLSAAACLAVLWTLFVLRMMGGGDVKLLTVLALWIRPAWFLKLIVVMAVLGGVLSVILAGWQLWRRRGDRLSVPYGVAISAAGLWVLFHDYWPLLHAGGQVG